MNRRKIVLLLIMVFFVALLFQGCPDSSATSTPIPTTYSVSYDDNGATGGSIPDSQTKTKDVNLTLASNSGKLLRTGYTFVGWNTAADGSGTNYAEGATYSANADLTLYAKWTALPTYSVSYDDNGATGGTTPTSQTKTENIDLILASNSGKLLRTGYTFVGWNTAADGSGTDYAEGSTYSANADLTLYAKWTALPTYSVSYDANGATGGTTPHSQIKIENTDLTLASNSGKLLRTGYTFDGWNTAADGSGTDYAEGATYSANADLTLYAKWTPTYSVSYDANGATGGSIPHSQTKIENTDLTLASNSGNLVRTGYTFDGWNTAADGSGTDYAEGATYTANTALTLYAKWTTLPTYSVSYDANGATGGTTPASQTKIENTDLTLASNSGNLVRTGYTFDGWNTAADGSGTDYAEGATYTANTALTLYAKWTTLPTYSVSYDANGATGGTTPASQTKIENTDLTLASNSGNLVRTGYTFVGWNTAADGSGTDYAEGATYSANADLTLYARWTPTYSVSYDANGATGGTTPASQTKTENIDLILASNSGNLVRTGYTLAGWNTAADGSGTDYAEGSTYSANADLTFYAKWTTLPTYSVSYDANGATGGSIPHSQTKTENTDLTLASNSGKLLRTGYTFAGWNTAADGGGTDYAEGATYTANTALTLYAKWTTLPTYSVSYNANGATGGSAPASQVKTENTDLTLSSNSWNLVRTGYTLAGWNTAADGSGTDYAEGSTYSANTALTLYAKWKVKVTMKLVPAGRFKRDSTATNISIITKPFHMSAYEITRAQFSTIMGADPSDRPHSSGTSDPVQQANWYHAIAFCNKLSIAEGREEVYRVSGVDFSNLAFSSIPTSSNGTWNTATADWTANGYRLPTEMEWMWAAMGAEDDYTKAFAGSDGSNAIGDYAWYNGNSNSKTHPAGTKLPNELGLYDMSGNVWEWVWDWHAAYPDGTLIDYHGAASGTNRVARGGGWDNDVSFCTVASRTSSVPPGPYIVVSFRVVRP